MVNWEDFTVGKTIATLFIWVLRVLLPMCLFWICFKFQQFQDGAISEAGEKDEEEVVAETYDRTRLLKMRPEKCEKSKKRGITMVTEDTHPELFVKTERKRDRDKRTREERLDDRRRRRGLPSMEVVEAERKAAAVEEQKSLEAMLNYVAFARKPATPCQDEAEAVPEVTIPAPEQTTTTTPNPAPEQTTPSPPPASPVKKVVNVDPILPTMNSAQANEEAQMVLRAAAKFGRVEVATRIYQQLTSCGVEINTDTFKLLVSTCVQAKDLQLSSDFLMKMESAGMSPAPQLLDQVMELYSSQKNRGVIAVAPMMQQPMFAAIDNSFAVVADDLMVEPSKERSQYKKSANKGTKKKDASLRLDAPEFVPSTAVVKTALTTDAPEFIPQAMQTTQPPAPKKEVTSETTATDADNVPAPGAISLFDTAKIEVAATTWTPNKDAPVFKPGKIPSPAKNTNKTAPARGMPRVNKKDVSMQPGLLGSQPSPPVLAAFQPPPPPPMMMPLGMGMGMMATPPFMAKGKGKGTKGKGKGAVGSNALAAKGKGKGKGIATTTAAPGSKGKGKAKSKGTFSNMTWTKEDEEKAFFQPIRESVDELSSAAKPFVPLSATNSPVTAGVKPVKKDEKDAKKQEEPAKDDVKKVEKEKKPIEKDSEKVVEEKKEDKKPVESAEQKKDSDKKEAVKKEKKAPAKKEVAKQKQSEKKIEPKEKTAKSKGTSAKAAKDDKAPKEPAAKKEKQSTKKVDTKATVDKKEAAEKKVVPETKDVQNKKGKGKSRGKKDAAAAEPKSVKAELKELKERKIVTQNSEKIEDNSNKGQRKPRGKGKQVVPETKTASPATPAIAAEKKKSAKKAQASPAA